MQTKYALKIIKYAFLVNKNTKICTKKFITIHKTVPSVEKTSFPNSSTKLLRRIEQDDLHFGIFK